MKLVVDTNVIYSLFKRDSFIKEFIIKNEISLFSVKELIEELTNDSLKICKITKCLLEEFEETMGLLPDIIEFVPVKQEFLSKADKLISHKTDVPFLALALELNIPIWSNDVHFKRQSLVEVFNTKELAEKLKSLGIDLE